MGEDLGSSRPGTRRKNGKEAARNDEGGERSQAEGRGRGRKRGDNSSCREFLGGEGTKRREHLKKGGEEDDYRRKHRLLERKQGKKPRGRRNILNNWAERTEEDDQTEGGRNIITRTRAAREKKKKKRKRFVVRASHGREQGNTKKEEICRGVYSRPGHEAKVEHQKGAGALLRRRKWKVM